MKTQLETLSSVKKKLTIDISAERVAEAIEKAYAKVQKKAKMKGFREGKVPRNLLEIHFKGDAENEAVDDLILTTYREAVEKEAVVPISKPHVVPSGDFKKDAPFSYTAEFDVHPVVEVKGYDNLSLEKTERVVTDEHVEKRLEAMRESLAQLEPAADDAVTQKGMIAFIDFDGKVNGKSFKGGKADNFLVEIGTGSLIEGFEDQLVGMKKGEKKTLEVTFPKDYHDKDLAGKLGVFDVTLKEIKIKKLPELNDDFAKDLGNYKNLAEVREDIKKRFLNAVEFEAKGELKDHAMEIMVKNHQFEVPTSIANEELKDMFGSFVKRLSSQGKKLEDVGMTVDQFIEKYKKTAEDRVRGYYILDAIAIAEKIEVTDAELENRFNALAAQLGKPVEKVKEYYTNNNLTISLKNQVLQEKTLDFIISKAKIKTKKPKK